MWWDISWDHPNRTNGMSSMRLKEIMPKTSSLSLIHIWTSVEMATDVKGHFWDNDNTVFPLPGNQEHENLMYLVASPHTILWPTNWDGIDKVVTCILYARNLSKPPRTEQALERPCQTAYQKSYLPVSCRSLPANGTQEEVSVLLTLIIYFFPSLEDWRDEKGRRGKKYTQKVLEHNSKGFANIKTL